MCKMGVIDKLRKKTMEKSQRRHFQAEERANTAGRVYLACHNSKRPVKLERGEGRETRSDKLGEAIVGSDYRASWVTDRILASEWSHDKVKFSF